MINFPSIWCLFSIHTVLSYLKVRLRFFNKPLKSSFPKVIPRFMEANILVGPQWPFTLKQMLLKQLNYAIHNLIMNCVIY